MKNLTLQGEICHLIPQANGIGRFGHIVSAIRNSTGGDVNTYTDHVLDINIHVDIDSTLDQRSKRSPVVFIITSQGYALALDENDQLVWSVSLEKVVLDSNEDSDDEIMVNDASLDDQWFYAGSFMQDVSPDDLDDNDGLGMDVNAQAGLHITCLSHEGHVVSISTDATTSIAMGANESCEEGSECIGSFENGLQCGGWSPDGEILALVTYADEEEQEEGSDAKIPILMTMNTQYEILSEIHLDPCISAEAINCASNHPNAISICWRPDSSSLAVSTMDANVNNKPLRRIRTFSATLQLISLSKEEDGSGRDVPNLLSIPPTWAPAGCSHYIGVIQSSRPLTLKSAKSRPASLQVAFMEPNGLRHRECKIHNTYVPKEEKDEVTGVSFNLEGDLLSVTSIVTSLSGESIAPYGKLQLYFRSNYHWYLKYELRFDAKQSDSSRSAIVSAAIFSAENPYKLTIALKSENSGNELEWREYTFRWDSANVNNHYKQSSALAMSVDGKKLNFTPLDKAMVPPPMYAGHVELSSPVVGITPKPTFYNDSSSKDKESVVDFIITMSNGALALLQSGNTTTTSNSMIHGFEPPSVAATIDLQTVDCLVDDSGLKNLLSTSLRDLTIIDTDENSYTVIALCSPQATYENYHNFDNLVEMKITWSFCAQTEKVDVNAAITESVQLESRALRIANWSDTEYASGARGSALVQLNDGILLEYNQGGVIEPCEAGPLLEPCPTISGIFDAHSNVITATAPIDENQVCHDVHVQRLVVGLSSRYRLYCGERLLSSASSSFEISLSHRFITHVTIGSRPHLHFLPIESLRDFDPFTESDNHAVLDGYEPRLVERGARLVSVFPSRPSLVLQMPRGNLEGISPRGLVLPYVMSKIENGELHEAFDIMRRQRVDLNLIVDLNPTNFLSCTADQLICQVDKIDNINLFISSLTDLNSTFKYPVPNWIRQGIPSATNIYGEDSKVNVVCKKMRKLMLDAEANGVTSSSKVIEKGHFLLPILSTFAKESPPKVEEALSLIKESALSKEQQSKSKSVLISDYAQSSIQYLAFLSDYELLFNTALGMYDFDLAKAVARHSQMDPKVYLPMLKRFRELPLALACFDVDVKLKRYESALRHLVASSSYNETDEETSSHRSKCMSFIEEHSLHKLGLELFQQDTEFYRSVMVSLGERLLVERKPEEALTVFLLADPKCLDGGKRAARACGDWRTYFACCSEDNDELSTDQITNLAEMISSKFGNMKEQSDAFASAARVLQDYCQDVGYAVDMLVSGRLWNEGRRVAHLHNRPDLVKKCVDASVTYAETCIDDLVDRASTFEKTIKRYAEVIELRRNAIKEAEEAGAEIHDDSASMFSMASTISNTSLSSSASGKSMGSVGSVGTVASVSTVISVGATSTFSFTGDVDAMKHKSKFNKIGRDKKKKKKKPRNSRRRKPGGEEELNELVTTLIHSCPDEYHLAIISSTLIFLLQSGKQSMAEQLLDSYSNIESMVHNLQTERIDADRKKQEEIERSIRMEGGIYQFVQHPCEKDIDVIRCKPLPENVKRVFSFIV